MADTPSTQAPLGVTPTPSASSTGQARATAALQRCILELQSEPPRYDVAARHLATASVVVLALTSEDGAPASAVLERDEGVAEQGPTDGAPRVPMAASTLAYRKAYCGKLCSVIARYLNDAETEELAKTLQRFAEGITARRYCPGLNDATYDLFARFALRQGSAT